MSSYVSPRRRLSGLVTLRLAVAVMLRRPVKAALRRLLARRNLIIVPKPAIEPSAELKIGLEHVLAHRMLARADFVFVQIGAFDGRSGDPIHDYITRYGWRGILVEPQKRYFARLKETYQGQPGLVFRNVAISERRGKSTLYKISEKAKATWAPQTASFDRDHVVRHAEGIQGAERGNDLIETEEVECITLSDLLSGAPAHAIDLLQIDAEGYDAEIIRMLDLDRFAPSIIRFEHKHLAPAEYETTVRRLAAHGYRLAQEGWDTLAYRACARALAS